MFDSVVTVIVAVLGLLIVALVLLSLADFFSESLNLVVTGFKFVIRCCRWIPPLCCLLISFVLLLLWIPVRILLKLPVMLGRRITLARLPETLILYENGSLKHVAVHPMQLIMEFPLAVLSIMLYKTARGILATARSAWTKSAGEQEGQPLTSNQWNSFLETDTIMNGGVQLSRIAIMTMLFMGPRWNTHGGAFACALTAVSDRVVFEVENVKRDGFWWYVRFYNAKGTEVGGITSSPEKVEYVTAEISQCAENEIISIYLHVYYHDGNAVGQLPAMRIDGKEVVPRRETAIGTTNFMLALRCQQNFIHVACQWYIFPMLALQSFLPTSFVKEELLPQNKETTVIVHGVAFAGFCIHITVDQAVLKKHLVFCTVYSRASMPTIGRVEVTKSPMKLQPCLEESIWLIRIVSRSGDAADPKAPDGLKVELTRNLEGLEWPEFVMPQIALVMREHLGSGGESDDRSEAKPDKKTD